MWPRWQACLDSVREGRIDLMPDVAYTAERDAVFDFPVTPVLHSWSQVYTRSDKPIVSVLDLQNRRILPCWAAACRWIPSRPWWVDLA